MIYDQMNRLTQRTAPDVVTNWIFDSAENGIGGLAEVTDSNGFKRIMEYDEVGKVVKTTTTIDNKDYTTTTDYIGSSNKVDMITYPSGQSTRNTYDEWGNHLSVLSLDAEQYSAYTATRSRF